MQVGEAATLMLSYIHHAAAEQNDKMGLIKDRERFPHLAACREEEEDAREQLSGLLTILGRADYTLIFRMLLLPIIDDYKDENNSSMNYSLINKLVQYDKNELKCKCIMELPSWQHHKVSRSTWNVLVA